MQDPTLTATDLAYTYGGSLTGTFGIALLEASAPYLGISLCRFCQRRWMETTTWPPICAEPGLGAVFVRRFQFCHRLGDQVSN